MRSHQNFFSVAVLGMLGTWALLAAVSCQGEPFIRINLDGRNPEITRIQFTGTIGKKSITKEFSKNSDLSLITVSLPEGTRGTFEVSIIGFLADGCKTAEGSKSIAITDDKVNDDVRIQMHEISKCGKGSYTLKTSKDTPFFGQITSEPPGIDCGSACSASFREGTLVKLTAKPNYGTTFTGWRGVPNCNSKPTCDVTLKSDLTIQAIFSGCTGWCNETPLSSAKTLYGINGQDTSSIVAVGASGTILTWDGSDWTPNTSPITATLRAVRVPLGPSSFAVGDRGYILTQQWGIKWDYLKVQTNEKINGVTGDMPDKMFVVGSGSTFWRGNSMGFSAVTCSPILTPGITLNAIATAQSGATHFLVGNGGFFLQHASASPNPDQCTKLTSQTTNNLLGLWVGANNIYLVGAGGTIVKCDALGSACKTLQSGTTTALHGIWGTNNDSIIYAVGEGGTILKSTTAGVTWDAEKSGTGAHLYAIWGADASTIYAVGQDGIILRYR